MNRHLIDDLCFETHLDQEISSHPPYNDWTDFCRERLLTVVDRIFDEFSADGDQAHRFEQLEVDLGELPHSLSSSEIEERFELALRQRLRDFFFAAQPHTDMADGPQVKTIPRASFEQDMLDHYMHNGFLFENNDSVRPYSLEIELARFADQSSEAAIELLLSDRNCLERTIRQLNDDALERLLRKLSVDSAHPSTSVESAETSPRMHARADEGNHLDKRHASWESRFLNALASHADERKQGGVEVVRTTSPRSSDLDTVLRPSGDRLPTAPEGPLPQASPEMFQRPQSATGVEAKHTSTTETLHADSQNPLPDETDIAPPLDPASFEKTSTPGATHPTESARQVGTSAHTAGITQTNQDKEPKLSSNDAMSRSPGNHDAQSVETGYSSTATSQDSASTGQAVQTTSTSGQIKRHREPTVDGQAPKMKGNRGGAGAPPQATDRETASPSRHDRPQLPSDMELFSDANSPDAPDFLPQAPHQTVSTPVLEGTATPTTPQENARGSSNDATSPPRVSAGPEDDRNTSQSSHRGHDAEEPPDGAAPTIDAQTWRTRVMARVSGKFAEAIERHGKNASDQSHYYRRLLEALETDDPIDPAEIAAQSGLDDGSTPGISDIGPSLDSERSAILRDPKWIERLLSTDSSALRLIVMPLLADPSFAAEAVDLWPAELLERVFSRLHPIEFGTLRPYAQAMASACVWDNTETRTRRMWLFLVEALFPTPRYRSTSDFVAAYADRIASDTHGMKDFRAALCAALPEGTNSDRSTQYIRYWLLGSSRTSRQANAPTATHTAIAIGNAGLVIISPYLPRLFDMLGLLQEGRFLDPAQARRACHLLQFTVDERHDAAEHELAINKLICGLDLRQPLDADITIDDQEKSTIEVMLDACITHWSALGNASIAGLRETFLQRPGQLTFSEDGWRLKVEKKTVDILMDRLPWSFSIIRHSWMAKPVFVEWL